MKNQASSEEKALDALISASLFPYDNGKPIDESVVRLYTDQEAVPSDEDSAIIKRVGMKFSAIIRGLHAPESPVTLNAPSPAFISFAMNRGNEDDISDEQTEREITKKRDELLKRLRQSEVDGGPAA